MTPHPAATGQLPLPFPPPSPWAAIGEWLLAEAPWPLARPEPVAVPVSAADVAWIVERHRRGVRATWGGGA